MRQSFVMPRRLALTTVLLGVALWPVRARATRRAADATTGRAIGAWLAEEIAGAGALDRVQSTLVIGPDGRANGSGGCNRFRTPVTTDGRSIRFGLVASTMMACTPAAMDQERRFYDALARARSFAVDPRRRKLTLFDAGGVAVMRLARSA